jgi:ABC-type phosphate/phosphonate transport system substrate-binding protein
MTTTLSSSTPRQLRILSKSEIILEGTQVLDKNLDKDITVAIQIK